MQSLTKKLFRGLEFAVLSCLVFSGITRAQDKLEITPGDKVIAKMDKALTIAKDQYFQFDAVTEEKGKDKPSVIKFEVTVKGTRFRRVEFLAPGDLKGMRVLVVDVNDSWVWLPDFHKIRRIATHTKAQGFFGTAYGEEEMSIVTYGPKFKGKLLAEDDTHWKIKGTLRQGQVFPYPKMIFRIRKDIEVPDELYYYNEKGMLVKTEKRPTFVCNEEVGACPPRVMSLIDHTRNNIKTTLIMRKWKINQGVPDSFFTRRALQRH